MKIDKSTSAAFTGHRDIDETKIAALKNKLCLAIEQYYDDGVTNFVCGMALGFDMMAAETVLSLRDELPDITLTAVIPFRGQDDRWNERNRWRYAQILDLADQVIYTSERFFKGCEMKRNKFMVENSCRLISYFNGEPHGGTYFTFNLAKEQNYPVTNLF